VDTLQRAFNRLPPAFRRGSAMLVDALIVMESFAVMLIVRVSGDAVAPSWPFFWPFAVFSALAFVLLLNWNRVYQSIPRYSAGIYQDVRVLSATAIAAGGLFLAVFCVGPFGFGIAMRTGSARNRNASSAGDSVSVVFRGTVAAPGAPVSGAECV
jgi:hypothetical protein